MSRTYKHITKDLKKNEYARRMFTINFEFWNYYSSEKERLKLFLIEYHWEGRRENAPKYFKQALNNSKRNKDKQTLIRHLKYDSFEDMSSFKWKNDANYYYF